MGFILAATGYDNCQNELFIGEGLKKHNNLSQATHDYVYFSGKEKKNLIIIQNARNMRVYTNAETTPPMNFGSPVNLSI